MSGDSVTSLLDAIGASLGGTVRSWREVSSEPTGTGSITGYELDLEGSGLTIPSHLVHVEHGAVANDDDVAVLENPETGERVRVWVYPTTQVSALSRCVHVSGRWSPIGAPR